MGGERKIAKMIKGVLDLFRQREIMLQLVSREHALCAAWTVSLFGAVITVAVIELINFACLLPPYIRSSLFGHIC